MSRGCRELIVSHESRDDYSRFADDDLEIKRESISAISERERERENNQTRERGSAEEEAEKFTIHLSAIIIYRAKHPSDR